MTERRAIILLWALFALALIGVAAGLGGLDGWVATHVDPRQVGVRWLTAIVAMGDDLTGTTWGDWVIGPGLIGAGVLYHRRALTRWGVAAGGSALSVFLILKPLAGRMRPHDALVAAQGGPWRDIWGVGGHSFSSGHVAHYGGLVLPLLFLVPRGWALWVLVPLLVAVQRVTSLNHYVSDAATSLALASGFTLLAFGVGRGGRAPLESVPSALRRDS